MNANHELERRLADFYATEAPQRASERVLDSVLAITGTTKQRRAVFRMPWRFPIMNSYAKMAIAAVAVIAIGAVGLAVLRPGSSSSCWRPRRPEVSRPSPSPSPLLSLTQTFTSDINGISVSYPDRWITRAATEPGRVPSRRVRLPVQRRDVRPVVDGPPLPGCVIAAARGRKR